MTLGEKNAPYYLAQDLLKAGKNKEAFEIYRTLAQDGDANCQVFLGWMLHEGIGTERNLPEAFEWFRRAASLGSGRGAFFCGKSLLVEKKYQEAASFFRESSKRQFSPGVLWLGICYINGWGLEQNLEKGLKLVEEAARLGNWMAKRKLVSLKIAGHYGLLGVIEGLLVLPYVIFGGLLALLVSGHSEKLMG